MEPSAFRLLKIAVVVMGVLIVIGLGVVGVTIARRLGQPPAPEQTTATAPQGGTEEKTGGTTGPTSAPMTGPMTDAVAAAADLALPPGSRIEEMTATDRLLLLRLRLAGGGEAIHLFALKTGHRVGVWAVQGAP